MGEGVQGEALLILWGNGEDGEWDVEMFGTCWIPVTVTDPSSVHCTKTHTRGKKEAEEEESQNREKCRRRR